MSIVNSSPQLPYPRKALRYVWYALAIVVGATVVVALFWPIADVLANHDIRHIPTRLQGLQLRIALDAARGRIIQVGAGILAIGGFVYTARNFAITRQQSELNRQTLELSIQGQVTDRYTKAIDQIGRKRLEVRIGGIYALERLAADSDRDQAVVLEVISAFVRRHARPRAAGDKIPRADVRAAMTVITRTKAS